MNKFNSKTEIYSYILDKFAKNKETVVVRGSTAIKALDNFDDFDIEVYGKEFKKPYYEVIFYYSKPILLSIYFYKDEHGAKVNPPREIKVLQGDYHDKIDSIFKREFNNETRYTKDELPIRKTQLAMDVFFKYMRSKDNQYLNKVNKKLNF